MIKIILLLVINFMYIGDSACWANNDHLNLEIKKDSKMVNIIDGIDKNEAIELTRDYISNNKMDRIIDINKVRKVYENGGNYGEQYWYITFALNSKANKSFGPFFKLKWAAFIVNKKTGIVQYLGEGPS